MARGLKFLPAFLLLASTSGFGQIIIPGVGFPGGGGIPGRRRTQQDPSQSGQSNATTLIGILRKIEDKDVIIEDDDKMITTVSIAGSTKYSGTSGGKVQIGDFQPGDRVNISVNQDSRNGYHATTMSMVREGTAEEHSAASLAVDDTSHPLGLNSSGSSSGGSASNSASNSSNSSAGRSSTSGSSGNNNHPVLRRASSSADDSSSVSSSGSNNSSSSSSDNDPDRPKLRRAASSSTDSSSSNSASSAGNSSAASSSSGGDGPPRLRRAVSGADDTTKAEIALGDSSSTSSATSSSPAAARPRPAPIDSDSDRPQLRRAPQADPNNTVAEARPSLHADDVNGVTRTPSAPQVGTPDDNYSHVPQRTASSGDDFIDEAREAAFSFSETLPNYVVKQFTTRYATDVARGGRTSWQALDTVTADIVEVDGTEQYKNILVNGKPPLRDPEKTGSWSRGEFSSLQLDVLSPLTNANFHGKRATTIVNRPAFRYDFSVEQPNSHWHVESEGQSCMPAYTGSIWIDKESHRTLRIELAAQGMPRNFPLDQVESAVDYDFVPIGDGKYLLPVHSEALSCGRGVGCSRNVIEFRNYKKFTADTSITFEADK